MMMKLEFRETSTTVERNIPKRRRESALETSSLIQGSSRRAHDDGEAAGRRRRSCVSAYFIELECRRMQIESIRWPIGSSPERFRRRNALLLSGFSPPLVRYFIFREATPPTKKFFYSDGCLSFHNETACARSLSLFLSGAAGGEAEEG